MKLEGKVANLYRGYVKADSGLFSGTFTALVIDAQNVFGIVDNRALLIAWSIPLFCIKAAVAGVSFGPDIESLVVALGF